MKHDKATKIPLQIDEDCPSLILDKEGYFFASTDTSAIKDNTCKMRAELIVKSVNAHDDLVSALKIAQHFMRNYGVNMERDYPEISAALAKTGE